MEAAAYRCKDGKREAAVMMLTADNGRRASILSGAAGRRPRPAYFLVTRSTGVSTTPDMSDCFLCSAIALSAVSMPNTACFAAY
jgi:hypothetical protein